MLDEILINDLEKRLQKICEKNNVSLKAWFAIQSELDSFAGSLPKTDKKADVEDYTGLETTHCDKCGDIRFKNFI